MWFCYCFEVVVLEEFIFYLSSLATEMVKGKTLEEALSLKNTDIAGHLKLPPVKLHCSMLAEDAVRV